MSRGLLLVEDAKICCVTNEAYIVLKRFFGKDIAKVSSKREDGQWDVSFDQELLKGIYKNKLFGESLSDVIIRRARIGPSRHQRRKALAIDRG